MISFSKCSPPPAPGLAAEKVGEVCAFSSCVLGPLSSLGLWDTVAVGWAQADLVLSLNTQCGHHWVWSVTGLPQSQQSPSSQNFLEMERKHPKETHLVSYRKNIILLDAQSGESAVPGGYLIKSWQGGPLLVMCVKSDLHCSIWPLFSSACCSLQTLTE